LPIPLGISDCVNVVCESRASMSASFKRSPFKHKPRHAQFSFNNSSPRKVRGGDGKAKQGMKRKASDSFGALTCLLLPMPCFFSL
jgi:hypothetical protein